MKVFVAFSALLAVASASHLYFAPRFIAPSASSQYHSQDGIGQYAFGYNDHLSTKQEVKSLDGTTRGSYSYIDANNVLQTVDYTADAGGFRVAATNLPKAPVASALELPKQIEDTAEVAAAKSAHLAAVEQAKLRTPLKIEGSIELPRQVMYTPEVLLAKDAHYTAIEEAKRRNRDQGSVVWAQAPIELPKQVQDTFEVAAAKAAHFAAIEEAKKQTAGQGSVIIQAPIELPQPVKDTPEVAKAKAEHLLAIEQAKIGNGISFIRGAPLVAPVQYAAYSGWPLARGFSYSTSTLNAPVLRYAAYAPYLNSQVGW